MPPNGRLDFVGGGAGKGTLPPGGRGSPDGAAQRTVALLSGVGPSPAASPRQVAKRGASVERGAGGGGGLRAALFRRLGPLVLLLLAYAALTSVFAGLVSDVPESPGLFFAKPQVGLRKKAPGGTYESPALYQRFLPHLQAQENSTFEDIFRWQHPKPGEGWRTCIDRPPDHKGLPEKSNGYIVIVANGGLNQQRTSICNAVAVARLLNATLIIPHFHLNPVWRDPSAFGDIFDEDHFVRQLAPDIRIAKELPEEVVEGLGEAIGGLKVKVPAWAPPSYYRRHVLPLLREAGAVRFSPFANRLSHDGVPPDVQRLRCFANFEALRFAAPIRALARKMLALMERGGAELGAKEPYVAVHLRFEKDMVAFSNCIYDGGRGEVKEMKAYREFGWRGKFSKKGRKKINPADVRRDGKCPLTPLEVGMMLRGMGFGATTRLFVAAGEIYGGERHMAPLRAMFPNLQTKHSLLAPEELTPFKNFSSRMAALDYTVCLGSEVFVVSQGGNFPQILVGHRRFLNRGHWKAIRPDKRHLALLFGNKTLRWQDFRREIEGMRQHSDEKGAAPRKPGASLYTFPQPECMCPEDAPPGALPGHVAAGGPPPQGPPAPRGSGRGPFLQQQRWPGGAADEDWLADDLAR